MRTTSRSATVLAAAILALGAARCGSPDPIRHVLGTTGAFCPTTPLSRT